jgi:tyrosyl-tRNA synthetase
MAAWFELLLGTGAPEGLSARDAKHALARALAERFHGAAEGAAAAEHFDRVFVQRDVPEDIEEAALPTGEDVVHLPALIADTFGGSRSEARRMLAQGGVKLDGEALGPEETDVAPDRLDGAVLQVGKRNFKRLKIAS